MPVTGAEVLGGLGVVLNQVFIWPQVRRAFDGVEGVAPLSVLGGLLARTAWTAYGASLGDLELLVGNITVAIGFLILLMLLLRHAQQRSALTAAAVAAGVVVLGTALASSVVLGWVAVASAAIVNLPQMVRAMTDPKRLAGVSVPTYVFIAAASGCWLSYGLLVHHLLISAPHVLLLPTALITAVVAARSHRRRGPLPSASST